MNKKIGIIDLGSNTVRLVIYEIKNNYSYNLVDDIKNPVRLIENMVDGKYINDFSMRKSIKTINLFRKLCLSYKIAPNNIIAVATAAVRIAENKNEFLELIEKSTGLQFRILTGEEESIYVHNGVKHTMSVDECIIVDIGGGSTQIIHTQNKSILNFANIPIGSIVATEKYLTGNSQNGISNLENYLTEILDNYDWLKSSNLTIVGVGGLIRTISKINMNITNYPLKQIHNYEISFNEISHILNLINNKPISELLKIKGMPNDRVDIFRGGLLILKSIFKSSNSTNLISSGCGLREGILYNYLFNNSIVKFTDVLSFSLNNYMDTYKVNNTHTNNVLNISMSLFNQLQKLHNLGANEQKLLHYAALLHNIGLNMGYHDHCDHTFYMITNAKLYGLTHREIILLASISASYRKNTYDSVLKNIYKVLLNENDLNTFYTLSLFLKLSERLNKSKTGIIEAIDCQISGDIVKIKTIHNGDAELEINLANDMTNCFLKLFSKKLLVY